MYADDTTIYFNLNDFPLINREIEINSELEKVNTWLKLNPNLRELNCSGTHFLLFTQVPCIVYNSECVFITSV